MDEEEIDIVLEDFIAATNAKPNLSDEDLLSKFPEFKGDKELLQSAFDYKATTASGKYADVSEIRTKFPEFFPPSIEKKNPIQSGLEDSTSVSAPFTLDTTQPTTSPVSESPKNDETFTFGLAANPEIAKERQEVIDNSANIFEQQEGLKGIKDRLESSVTKSPLKLQGEDINKIRTNLKESELRAKAISRATGKPESEILKSDENYKQSKLKETRIKGNDYAATFGANLFNASAGIAGTPNAIIESVGRLFISDEEYEAIPEGMRENFFSDLIGNIPSTSAFGALAKSGKERQTELLDESKQLREIATQYDSAITEDIWNLDLKQAGKRIAVEGIGSIPSLIQAITPYIGLATIATGTAANKLEENKEDGEFGKKDVADAWINGVSEGLLESVTRGLAKKAIGAFGKAGKDQAKTLSKSLVDNLIWAPVKEGGSESATSIVQNLSDAFVLGNEVQMQDVIYEILDSFVIGGAVGGGLGSVTAVGEGLQIHRKAIEGDKKAQKKIENKTPIEGAPVELNVPAESEVNLPNSPSEAQETGSEAEVNLPQNETSFNPLESEGESIARLKSVIESGKTVEEVAAQHTESYFNYLKEGGQEVVADTDFAKNFESDLVEALNGEKEFDPNQERSIENGSRIDENGDPISESEFLESKDKLSNETTPAEDTEVDGNVPVGDNINKPETVQPTAEPTASKAAPKTTEVTVGKGNFNVEFNENDGVAKIFSAKDGREIPKLIESTRKDGTKYLRRNGNWSSIESKALGQKTENQILQESKEELAKAFERFTPTTEYDYALEALAKGEGVKLQSLADETGLSKSELKWATAFKKESELPSVERLSEIITENAPQELDQQAVRDAIIDIASNNTSKSQLESVILDRGKESATILEEQALFDYLSGLTPEQLAVYESVKAEDDYLAELSDTDALEYLEEQYGKAENIEQVREIEDSGVQERDGEENTEQASQSRNSALTRERIKPARKTPSAKPKKIGQIISDVSKNLKATIFYGKSSRRNSIGTYNPSNTLVRIRRAGDLDTVAHEIGHLIDDRYDIVGSTEGAVDEILLVNQLKWFSDRGGSNPPSSYSKKQKAQYLEREGMGEFIRAYVANPAEAKIIAPELYAQFEKTVDPKDLAFIKEFSTDYLNFANATAFDKINSQIEDADLKKKKGYKDYIDGFVTKDGELKITHFDKLQANWTNSMAIPQKMFRFVNELKGTKSLNPEEDFNIVSRLFLGINGKIENALGKGLVNTKNERITDSKGLTMDTSYLLNALDTSSQKQLQKEMQETMAYMVSERTVEYLKKLGRADNLTGIGGGIDSDLSVAVEYINDIENLKDTDRPKYDRIKESARRYREFADAGLRYMVDSGRLSEADYQRIKETNEYYVSLARTNELVPNEELVPFLKESSKISSVKEVIKKAKGGTKTIQNPYLSLLQNTVNMIKESDRNRVMSSFVEPLSELRQMGDGSPIDFSQVAVKAKSGGDRTIPVFENGEKVYYQFQKDLYDALKGLEGIASNKLINFFAKPADLIRFTVTHFPVFAARNAARDTVSRLIVSRTGANVTDLRGDSNDKDFWELYGGSQAGFYLTNKESYKEVLSDSVKKITDKGGIVLDPRKINYKNYKKLLQSGENLNRIAEFRSAMKKAKKEGMDDYNAGLYAAFQSRDLMDFGVAGNYMRTINKLIPFANASVQSVKRSAKGIKENPAGFAMRTALYTVLPQIAFRAIVSAMGDEEEYEQLPDWQRDLFWNFKTPLTGNEWISIPKPFELGLPSSLLDRAYSKLKGNDEAFDGSLGSSIKTLFPFDEAAMLGSIRPIIEVSSNHDFFRDRDIIPYWERTKDMELREGTKYASRLGQALSKAYGFIAKPLDSEIDPRQIDHIVKGYGTYFGDWALSISDIGREDSRNQFNFTKTGFAKGMPTSQAKSVKKAIGLAEDMGITNQYNIKKLKGMTKSFYDLDDPKERKKLSKEIYAYAKKIIPDLEEQKRKKIKKAKSK